MKKGKELNVKLHEDFKTYYGTIDNKSLKTIYAGISTWITPNVESDEYSSLVSNLRKIIKSNVHRNINYQLFNNEKYIVDVDVKGDRVNFNKKSFLNIEVTLFVKNGGTILSESYKSDMHRFLNTIIGTMRLSNNFKFSNKKLN
jgi:hypothetical protein